MGRKVFDVKEIYGDLSVLETERLVLRKMTIEDAEDMFEYASNLENCRYLPWVAHYTIEDTKEVIKNMFLKKYEEGQVTGWAIEHKEDKKMIGTVGFVKWFPRKYYGVLGYCLSKHYWGKGYMTEAAKKVIEFGFEKMGMERIVAKCHLDNIGSSRVMEKSGMKFEGISRREIYLKKYDDFYDGKCYSITRPDYYRNKA